MWGSVKPWGLMRDNVGYCGLIWDNVGCMILLLVFNLLCFLFLINSLLYFIICFIDKEWKNNNIFIVRCCFRDNTTEILFLIKIKTHRLQNNMDEGTWTILFMTPPRWQNSQVATFRHPYQTFRILYMVKTTILLVPRGEWIAQRNRVGSVHQNAHSQCLSIHIFTQVKHLVVWVSINSIQQTLALLK